MNALDPRDTETLEDLVNAVSNAQHTLETFRQHLSRKYGLSDTDSFTRFWTILRSVPAPVTVNGRPLDDAPIDLTVEASA